MGAEVETPKFRAWYATTQMAVRALEAIERDVQSQTGIPVAWLEALCFLLKHEDGRRRMSELADQACLSRGGATRLISRMELEGLVTREIPPEDRRATYAVITQKGRETVERVFPVHQAAVERYFTDAIDDDEAHELRAISLRVLELVGERCEWLMQELATERTR